MFNFDLNIILSISVSINRMVKFKLGSWLTSAVKIFILIFEIEEEFVQEVKKLKWYRFSQRESSVIPIEKKPMLEWKSELIMNDL